MAAAVATVNTKLFLHATKVGQPKGADLAVVVGVTCQNRQIGWRFGSLRAGPDNVRCLNIHVG